MAEKEIHQDTSPDAISKSERRTRDKALARKARAGDARARETLITEHLYLVDKIMRFYAGKGVPEDVLYQEGCYGLILAVDRYDPDRNTALDTYASYYVKRYLWQAMLDNAPHPIVLKQKSARQAMRYREAAERLTGQLGRPPSNQEIADELGISYQTVTSLMLIGDMQAISLDSMEAEDRTPLIVSGRGVEEDVLNMFNEMCLDDFPVTLSPTEEEILLLRFGFGRGGKPHTFDQIGKLLNLSADTVSVYCSRALQKLRDAKSGEKIL